MADKDALRFTNEVSKSTCEVQIKLALSEMEDPELDPIKNLSKRRKTETSGSEKVGIHIQKKSACKKKEINVENGVDEQQKWCHQCRRNERGRVVECKKCQSKKFCVTCMTKWYPDVSEKEFVEACPVCRNNCNCKACLRGFSPKGYSCSKSDQIQYSKYILRHIFPLASCLSEEELMEKEIEAKAKGLSISELQLQDAECDVDDNIYCDNCGAYFFDFFRSCTCGYDLCLVCCRDLRDGNLQGGNGMKCGWKSCIDGRIPCPPKEIGGCNVGILELKRIMPVDWVVKTLEKAQRIYKINNSNDIPQTSRKCCMCYDSSNEALGDDGKLQKESIQEKSNSSYLYSPSAKDIKPQDIQHFQLHWSKGEPIIVSDLLSTSSGLSWEPMVLWRAFRDVRKSSNYSHANEVNAIDCFDWSEVTVGLNKFFTGYSECRFEKGWPPLLKLEDWKPSCLSQGEWPRHFVEFIGFLPFKDYTHPQNGYLNVAVKLPNLSSKPDMGPRMDIAYGFEEELEYGNSVTKLHYDKADTVVVLTHTQALVCEEGQECMVDTMKEGALWDIFRRQDIPKLELYLRTLSRYFKHADGLSVGQIVHPIHDRIYYLNMEHKRKLKEEFGIEPWTFKQKLGDAVFIPAGCPYQVRNLKSNTKVELNFISPESLGECNRLQHELRMLPINHRAKQNMINIGKMMFYALDQAVVDLERVGDSNGPTDHDDLQYAIVPVTLNDYTSNIFNHTHGILPDKRTSEDHLETVAVWRGNAVGLEVKELLEAIEHHYPNTFQGVKIRLKSVWNSILKEFHVFMKGFLNTSVDTLVEEQLTSLQEDINEFERFGFDLSWARKRLDMVQRLKFGNEPLQQELIVLEKSLESSRVKVGGLWNQLREVYVMLQAAQ